ADFALIDQALVGRVDELDRVFDGEDVLAVVPVDPVEHRRNRRTLTATRHTGQQHHALVELAQVLHHGRQVQSLKVGNEPLHLTRNHAPHSELNEQVDAESPRFALVVDDV